MPVFNQIMSEPAAPPKDSNTVIELREKFSKLEEQIKELMKIKEELTGQIKKETQINKDEIAKQKVRIDALESKYTHLSNWLVNLSSTMDNGAISGEGSHIDLHEWEEFKRKIDRMKGEIQEMLKEIADLNELQKKFTNLSEFANTKLDKQIFEEWKENPEIDRIIVEHTKKFAFKSETIRLIRGIEKKVQSLENAILKGQSPNQVENTMLAKKPLGGWSCASCQNFQINLDAGKDPYFPWAKLPKRNSVERIAKVNIEIKNS